MLKKKVRTCLFLLVVIISIDCILGFLLQKQNVSEENPVQESSFEDELIFFPVPLSSSDAGLTVSFVDTWKTSRDYGGDRLHEGCDIITSADMPGVYPVLSISDGVVEKLGWLELGGYRVGIRNESGLYLYYAHLESYAPDLKEGDQVSAGECIGFVGNTGYGEEGTTGKFVTHLHMGFYLPGAEGDTAINPYPYLLELEKKQLKYHYQEPEYVIDET